MAAGADLVLLGGHVWTPGWSRSRPAGIAVRAGRIVAVGDDHDLKAHVSSRTEVVGVDGALVLPGFQDAHAHPIWAGIGRLRCDLSELPDAATYLGEISAYAAAKPDRDWVLGRGWSMDAFVGGTPDAATLDTVVPDRPAYFVNRDGHGAWVNSRALDLAGITAMTPDPPDGRIERATDGTPTGTLHEGAMDLVGALVPPPTTEELDAALRTAQGKLHALGITAWQDASVGDPDTKVDTLAVYRRAADSGELTARVVGALWWERDREADQIEELVQRRRDGTGGHFRATTVKIMQDGVLENFTAAMIEPYLDASGESTGGRGISFLEPPALVHAVTRLDEEGFQVHVHAIGDRAVREALDAFAAARRANGPSRNRHHIAHLQVVHPDDHDRFAELDVVANAQPLWAMNEPQMTELTLPFLGPERARLQYPWRTLQRHGARLAFGSDWPVTSADPMWGVHVAVNRTAPRGYADGASDWPPFLPEERITLVDALTAYTSGAAYVNHLDDESGRLEPGLAADVAIVEPDPFDLDEADLDTVSVRMTLVDGVPVHT